MLHVWLFLLAAADGPPRPPPPTVTPFRTEAAPRVDPVFPDVGKLRASIDHFLALQTEMERVRDEFSASVHDTLTLLSGGPGRPPVKSCPGAAAASYLKALDGGRRFLALGRRLEARFREVRRSDDLGDAVGLTPDYRWKTKRVRELYQTMLRDYREMRVAFYDQLGAELRHAGCKLGQGAAGPAKPAQIVGSPSDLSPDPANPADWELTTDDEAATPAGKDKPRPGAKDRPEKPTPEPAASAGVSPAIWIEIDNTRCGQPSNLTLDGVAIGEIAAQKKVSVRTRSGPHELCVLPATDKRPCGAPGTLRRAYLYEGWTLAVRCEK